MSVAEFLEYLTEVFLVDTGYLDEEPIH